MASLSKKEVFIRGNSSVTMEKAREFTIDWMNELQEEDSNKDMNGNYIKYFFADIFDSRTKNEYKVFSDEACTVFKLNEQFIPKVTVSEIVMWSDISSNDDMSKETHKIPTRGAINQAVRDFISVCSVVNDASVIKNNKIVLSKFPSGIIGNKCQVRVDENTYEEVDCTSDGYTLTIQADEDKQFDDMVCLVSYLTKS